MHVTYIKHLNIIVNVFEFNYGRLIIHGLMRSSPLESKSTCKFLKNVLWVPYIGSFHLILWLVLLSTIWVLVHELDIIWLVVIFGKGGDDKKNQISSIAYQDDLHHLLVAMFKPEFFLIWRIFFKLGFKVVLSCFE